MTKITDGGKRPMTKKEELDVKLGRIRSFMEKSGYQGTLFLTQHNFSWLTCGGDDSIIHGVEQGFGNILVTQDDIYLLTNNIEMPRIVGEETDELDFKTGEYNWAEGSIQTSINGIIGDGKLALDSAFSKGAVEQTQLDLLRVPLTESEVSRYKELGQMCAQAMDETMRGLNPGMTEYEIQGLIGQKLLSQGIYPLVLLVGTDDRIFKYRHPMPTAKKLERYCMVVICAAKWGLVLNMTRLVYFGDLPNEIQQKYQALKHVDMAYITATKPGRKLSDVFTAGKKIYKEVGFEGEEKKHFQGGTCGYLTREQGLSPDNEYVIQDGEIFAHNPSITGVKLEDSILIQGDNYEILTLLDSWPSSEVEYEGTVLKRPDILIR